MKNIKKISKYLILLIMLVWNFWMLYVAIKSNNSSQIGATAALPLSLAIPIILEKIFKLKFNDNFKIVFYLFVFLAQFLGSCCCLYDKLNWYDNFTHFLSGVFSCYVAMYFLNIFHFSIQKNLILNCLFLLGIVSLIAISWEFIEFGIDNFLKMNMQHALDTGVKDTMFDMLSAFLGALIFIIGYSYEYLKKKSGIIIKTCKELC